MRSLAIKVIAFFALIEGLARIDFLALLLVLGLGIAAVVCVDLATSLSSRAQ